MSTWLKTCNNYSTIMSKVHVVPVAAIECEPCRRFAYNTHSSEVLSTSTEEWREAMRLAGKVALISGAARGMGAVEARLFAQEGAKVVIGDILEAEGRKVEADIRAAGGEAVFVRLDVTREADWQQAVTTAEGRFGALHILVNNAGVSGHGKVEDTPVEEWHRVMDINATGVFLGSKTAISAMRRAGGGSIINISSQLGLVGWTIAVRNTRPPRSCAPAHQGHGYPIRRGRIRANRAPGSD